MKHHKQAEIEASSREGLFYRAGLRPWEPSPARGELRGFLCGQPVAVIYTLMLIMYAGRGDVEVTSLMEEYHERHYAFGNPTQAVDHMLSKVPLPDYLEARLGAGVDVAEQAGRLAELAEDVDIVVAQLGAGVVAERGSIAILGDGDAALVGHLEEKQVGDLLDVVAVIDAVVAESVAETPEFLNDVGHKRKPNHERHERHEKNN